MMISYKEINNALKILETLRYNDINIKNLRFLGLKDKDIQDALELLDAQGYAIENKGGLLVLKSVPLFNLSAVKCSYMKNHVLSDYVNADHQEELNRYMRDYKEPYFIYAYRKWNKLTYKEMRNLVKKEMERQVIV